MELDAASLKTSSLILLAFQNFAYGLLLPISRRPDKDGNVFFGPTAVVTTELIKIVIALCGLLRETKEVEISAREARRRTDSVDEKGQFISSNIIEQGRYHTYRRIIENSNVSAIYDLLFQAGSVKLLIPSLLFVLQNNLQIQSASYLDATEFQVLSQLKLVTAAICSVIILKRNLSMKHWTSILFLILGICVVQQASNVQSSSTSLDTHVDNQAFLIGSITMLAACCFSGVASITVEYLLKNETGFWASNLLLATYSIIPASVPLFADVYRRGQFDIYRHFTTSVWSAIVLNALGGLLVSMVMKYADNILKGFAVAASLIATVLLQSHASFSWSRIAGASIVVGSMVGYSHASTSSPSSSSTTSPLPLSSPSLPQVTSASIPHYEIKLDTMIEEE